MKLGLERYFLGKIILLNYKCHLKYIANVYSNFNSTINNLHNLTLNKIKNVLGTPKVIVVCSQLGTPIAVYGGKEVYWEIPSDMPKMTKLNVDGKALYIHRANYILLDSDIIEAE